MELFETMNRKLEEGWKLTDGNCPECKSIVMFDPKTSGFMCLKCKKKVDMDSGKEKEELVSEQKPLEPKREEPPHPPAPQPQKSERPTSDEVSKRMSEKLLQGWAMLEKICDDCNVPLMRSKKGDEICYGCNRNYKKQATPQPTRTAPPPKMQVPSTSSSHHVPQQQKRPAHLGSKPPGVISPSSEEVNGIISQLMLKSLSFFNHRIDAAISRGDEIELTRLLGSIQKVAEINRKISNQ